jgi:hypothetical protein
MMAMEEGPCSFEDLCLVTHQLSHEEQVQILVLTLKIMHKSTMTH